MKARISMVNAAKTNKPDVFLVQRADVHAVVASKPGRPYTDLISTFLDASLKRFKSELDYETIPTNRRKQHIQFQQKPVDIDDMPLIPPIRSFQAKVKLQFLGRVLPAPVPSEDDDE